MPARVATAVAVAAAVAAAGAVGAHPRVALRLQTQTTPTPAATTKCAIARLAAVVLDLLLAAAPVAAVRGVVVDADPIAGTAPRRLAAL